MPTLQTMFVQILEVDADRQDMRNQPSMSDPGVSSSNLGQPLLGVGDQAGVQRDFA